MAGPDVAGIDRPADVGVADEPDTLAFKLFDPAIDVVLGHLEVGNAVRHQAAGTVVALVDGDGMTSPAQLLGGGQARGPLPMTATRLPVSTSGASA